MLLENIDDLNDFVVLQGIKIPDIDSLPLVNTVNYSKYSTGVQKKYSITNNTIGILIVTLN